MVNRCVFILRTFFFLTAITSVLLTNGQTVTFTGSGSWHTPANWSSGVVPGPGNDVVIGSGKSVSVSANVSCRSISQQTNSSLNIGASRSVTITNNVTVAASSSFTLASGSILTLGGNFTNSGNLSLTNGTVMYNGANTQNVASATYGQLSFSGSGTKQATGGITVNNTLTIQSGSTFDLKTFTLSGVSATAGTGRLHTQSISATAIPQGKTWTFDVHFNSVAASQTIPAGNYTNLNTSGNARTFNGWPINISGILTPGTGPFNLSNCNIAFTGAGLQEFPALNYSTLTLSSAGSIKKATGNLNLQNVNLQAGVVLDMAEFKLLGVTNLYGAGTIRTASTATDPIPAGVNWNNAIEYNAPAGTVQTIVSGTYNAGLICSGANSTKNFTAGISAGTLTINNDVTVNAGSHSFSVNLTAPANSTGVLQTQASLEPSKTWNFAVEYNSTSPQNVAVGTYSTLITTNSYKTYSGTSTITITNNLVINAGSTLDLQSPNARLSGAFSTAGTGTLKTQCIYNNPPLPESNTWSFDVQYYASGNPYNSQQVVSGSYANLSIAGGTRTLSTDTIFISGSFEAGTPANTNITNSNHSLSFNGTADQIVPALPGGYNNLILEGDSSTKTLVSDIVVNGNMIVETGAIANLDAFVISGTGSFRLESGATIVTQQDNGLNAAILVSGSTLYNSNANYQFNGNSTGNFTTYPNNGDVQDLIINNSAGTQLQSSKRIKGKLIFKTGNLSVGPNKLTIDGQIEGSGKLVTTEASELEIGSNNATIGFANGANKLKKLIIKQNAKLEIVDTLVIHAGTQPGTVVLEQGSSLLTNDKLVLHSTANGTSAIEAIPTNNSGVALASITGTVISERYIPGKRAYRFLGHYFNINQPLSILTSTIDITGAGGAANGFTPSGTNNPSAFRYDNNAGWAAFTNTNGSGNNAWKPYQGIRLMVRGSKGQGLTTNNYIPANVVLSMKGNINTGNITVPLTKGTVDGYNLVGNPYPAAVNVGQALATASNISGAGYWVWNAGFGTQGGYEVILTSDNYYVPSGAAFFVNVTNNTSLVFKESYKASVATANLMKTGGEKDRITLQLASGDTTWDKCYILNNTLASDSKEDNDAGKFTNPDADLYSLSADNQKLSVDARALNSSTVIPLGLKAANGSYQIRFANFNIPDSLTATLVDNFTNSVIAIDGGTTYGFQVTSDAATKGNGRLKLVFAKNTTLPIEDVVLTARLTTASTVKVDWNIHSTTAINKVELLRSGDGYGFEPIYFTTNHTGSHSFVDKHPINGDNFYRLKINYNNGSFKYSSIARVRTGGNDLKISTYPNPAVKGETVYLDVQGMKQGGYTVTITDISGRIIKTYNMNIGASQTSYPLGDLGTLSFGIYNLTIAGEAGKYSTRITMR